MKNIKYILNLFLVIATIISCTPDDNIPDVNSIKAPTNVAAVITIAQDNSGLVTITPTAENAANFRVNYGDGTGTDSGLLNPGESTQNTYEEGAYDIVIAAIGINGKTTTVSQNVVISFQAPENLVVTIENDTQISKQVNVTATADYAISYEVNFGDGTDPIMFNQGETVSSTYADAGTYTIVVTAFSGSVDTLSYSEEFVVTEIESPITAAPTPPTRETENVISIYSGAYTGISGSNFYPDWGQSTTYEEVDVEGDLAIKYGNLNYQGIQLGETVDASAMEYLHIDVWTADATQIEIYPISVETGEQQVTKALVTGQWNSFDILVSDFTSQGLDVSDLHQFKFVGSGTVFIDNLYFHKAPSNTGGDTACSVLQDFEGAAPSFTAFGNIADIQVVTNPDVSGINTTATVAQSTKTAGSEVWAGSFFDLSGPMDLTTCNKLSVKTWSPKTGATIRLKVENTADNSEFFETDLTTTVSNQWEELVFDLSEAQDFDYDRVVIFFDFGVSGDDSVYYYDEFQIVSQASNSGNSGMSFQNFEGTAPAFTAFGNIADVVVVANPDASGANITANVAQFTKTAGSEVWAGAFFDTDTPLDLTTYSKISLKSWSPKAGATVRMKIENTADNTQFFEQDVITSTVNSWEELVFDVSEAQAFDYDRVVIFYDFGVSGDDAVYYYDEFELKN